MAMYVAARNKFLNEILYATGTSFSHPVPCNGVFRYSAQTATTTAATATTATTNGDGDGDDGANFIVFEF